MDTDARPITSVRETERKYESDGAQSPTDDRVNAVLTATGARRHGQAPLEAVYFDTSDLRLLSAGITLRRRAGGDDAGWHLKLPAGPDEREELRLPPDNASAPPPELVALVRGCARGQPLLPVAELDTLRVMWQHLDASGTPDAELTDDQVTAHTPDGSGASSWREIEVELAAAGSPALLDDIEKGLRASGFGPARARSKLAHALDGRTSVAPRPSLGRRATAGQVLLAYLREQTDMLGRLDPLVRLDRPDAVHRMRVAARRMRSATQAFGRVLDRARTAGPAAELAWLAGELAPARDVEVIGPLVTEALDRLPADLVLGPVPATLARQLCQRTEAAHARVLAALDSERYLRLLKDLDAMLAEPPLLAPASRRARAELPRAIARTLDKVRAAMRTAGAADGVEQDTAVHEARKAAKRLRYATEVVTPVVGRPAERLQQRLRPLQDLFGDHQDTVVARAVLLEIATSAHADGENTFTYGLLHAGQGERATRLRSKMARAWADADRPKVRSWLP